MSDRIISDHKIRIKGFTLTEVLVVVGIVAILLTVSLPNLIVMEHRLHQSELDEKAKIIYAAAQNQLVKMQAAGTDSMLLTASVSGTAGIHYISSDSGSVSEAVIPEGVLEDSLMDNNWIVEFDPKTARVTAVYYSEESPLCTDSDYSANYLTYNQNYRNYESRMAAGAEIGYYGRD